VDENTSVLSNSRFDSKYIQMVEQIDVTTKIFRFFVQIISTFLRLGTTAAYFRRTVTSVWTEIGIRGKE
jgi:hypothetical protein